KRNITPFKYIDDRIKMNKLYDKVDGILTKAGGVTISESITKEKPIFIYDTLPGQERINVKELKRLGIIVIVESKLGTVEQFIIDFFKNNEKLREYKQKLKQYNQLIDEVSLLDVLLRQQEF